MARYGDEVKRVFHFVLADASAVNAYGVEAVGVPLPEDSPLHGLGHYDHPVNLYTSGGGAAAGAYK